ncbi:hydroxyisourate hydrolase [Carboxylicivirga taeanensis]|uniref:hydroxyisourate hydrolase n=1 Tax=Carboxylicivirga taeanensis TaxID=1416875 RepID=UPI003F6DFD3E
MKKALLITILFVFTVTFKTVSAQEKVYQLSSHILDITVGQPAKNVEISLFKLDESGDWILVDKKLTDNNGRVNNFLENKSDASNRGIFKLKFETKPYFISQKKETFYPFVEVVFDIQDDNHYHVPLTLTPFGYSTYRGN